MQTDPVVDDGRMQPFGSVEALFKGRHFDGQIIVLCVSWYTSFKLSLRDLVIMMADRGIPLTHTTIMRWGQHYLPEFEKRWSRYDRTVGGSWRMDETYLKVRGSWVYLDRAVDKAGRTVDFFLSRNRDVTAAKTFLRNAMKNRRTPTKITLDASMRRSQKSRPTWRPSLIFFPTLSGRSRLTIWAQPQWRPSGGCARGVSAERFETPLAGGAAASMGASAFCWRTACQRRGGNPPAPAFPRRGKRERGSSNFLAAAGTSRGRGTDGRRAAGGVCARSSLTFSSRFRSPTICRLRRSAFQKSCWHHPLLAVLLSAL